MHLTRAAVSLVLSELDLGPPSAK